MSEKDKLLDFFEDMYDLRLDKCKKYLVMQWDVKLKLLLIQTNKKNMQAGNQIQA